MLAVAVFTLAIFYWALRVALPADKIEQLISDGAARDQALSNSSAVTTGLDSGAG
jgi:hypothetical protein